MSTSKTGKHGHAKVHLVAVDVSFQSPSSLPLLPASWPAMSDCRTSATDRKVELTVDGNV
jgi:hypothetical protein